MNRHELARRSTILVLILIMAIGLWKACLGKTDAPDARASSEAIQGGRPEQVTLPLAVALESSPLREAVAVSQPVEPDATGPQQGSLVVQVSNGAQPCEAFDLAIWPGDYQGPTTKGLRLVATDATGSAVVALPSGPYQVRGEDGHVESVVVQPSLRTLVSWYSEVREIAGQVVDGEDRPVSGAEIWQCIGSVHIAGHPVGAADAGGRFALRLYGLRPILYAKADGYRPSFAIECGELGTMVKLVLDDPVVWVKGRALDRDEQPIEGVSFFVASPMVNRYDVQGKYEGARPPIEPSVSDAQGAFQISASRSACRIVGQRDGYVTWTGTMGVPPLAPIDREGKNAWQVGDVTVVMEPAKVIYGTVMDASGRSLSGATVRHGRQGEWDYMSIPAGNDGAFRIAVFGSGQVVLRASCKIGLETWKGGVTIENGVTPMPVEVVVAR